MNPYVGCGFGCSYCFAANFVADETKKAAWGEWVDIKHDALRQIARTDVYGKRIFMSSATDPYQPVETQTLLTRSIVEFMSAPHRQPSLTVQTRSPLVARDLDLLQRYDYARVQMSITTDDDEMRKRFEPRCASIDRRFEALEQTATAGVRLGVSVAPMLPIRDPKSFVKRIADLKPSAVSVQGFRRSKNPFAADTRPEGLQIAKGLGWDEAGYLEVLHVFRETFGDRIWVGPSSFEHLRGR